VSQFFDRLTTAYSPTSFLKRKNTAWCLCKIWWYLQHPVNRDIPPRGDEERSKYCSADALICSTARQMPIPSDYRITFTSTISFKECHVYGSNDPLPIPLIQNVSIFKALLTTPSRPLVFLISPQTTPRLFSLHTSLDHSNSFKEISFVTAGRFSVRDLDTEHYTLSLPQAATEREQAIHNSPQTQVSIVNSIPMFSVKKGYRKGIQGVVIVLYQSCYGRCPCVGC
jgi:hypothetical protein